MPVELSDRTGGPAPIGLAAAAERLLALLDVADRELDVVLVDDETMRELNRTWRGKDRPTDVLSFPQDDGLAMAAEREAPASAADATAAAGAAPESLGDVVISVPTARQQAECGGWSLQEEATRLLLHGVLHLLGHDHEAGGEPEALMKAAEARLATELVDAGFPCAREELA